MTELKRLDGNFISLAQDIKNLVADDITKLKIDIAVLKSSTKRDAKLSGLIGGAIPAAVAMALYFFK